MQQKRFQSLIYLLLCALIFSGYTGCKNNDDDGSSDDIPVGNTNWIMTNGRIYTVNPNAPWADAMIIENGVITFVGSSAQAQAQAPANAFPFDLEGRMVLPGLHDVHMHPLEASSPSFQFSLDGEETNPENWAMDVQLANQQNPGSDWLLGWGHFLLTLLDANRSPREILDDVVPNRPVAILELTSHSVWCNTAALNTMGLTAASPDPVGGVLLKDGNGELNGILIDNAGDLVIHEILQATPTSRQNDYDGLVSFGLPQLRQNGITSICDARAYWKRDNHLTWQRLADNDQLTARVNVGLWAYPSDEDAAQIAKLQSLYTNDPNSLLRFNQIKLYSDGIVGNTTAALHTDYLVDLLDRATNNGLNYFTEERLGQYIAALEPTGFDFHIHSIGNRGTTEALNAIEQNASGNGRHRLTHLEIVDPADLSRFATLNVTADCQVAGDFTNPDQWDENEAFVGAGLTDAIVPLKSLVDANARLTLSSDWDVSDLNPFPAIQNAVTRAPQNISLAQAIQAYTINSAYVMRQENKVGSLEVGKEADLIVLDRDLFTISPNQIGQTQVLTTFLQGEIIFER